MRDSERNASDGIRDREFEGYRINGRRGREAPRQRARLPGSHDYTSTISVARHSRPKLYKDWFSRPKRRALLAAPPCPSTRAAPDTVLTLETGAPTVMILIRRLRSRNSLKRDIALFLRCGFTPQPIGRKRETEKGVK